MTSVLSKILGLLLQSQGYMISMSKIHIIKIHVFAFHISDLNYSKFIYYKKNSIIIIETCTDGITNRWTKSTRNVCNHFREKA